VLGPTFVRHHVMRRCGGVNRPLSSRHHESSSAVKGLARMAITVRGCGGERQVMWITSLAHGAVPERFDLPRDDDPPRPMARYVSTSIARC
jgi:hypothetical protein